jgi:hypothetical protein
MAVMTRLGGGWARGGELAVWAVDTGPVVRADHCGGERELESNGDDGGLGVEEADLDSEAVGSPWNFELVWVACDEL